MDNKMLFFAGILIIVVGIISKYYNVYFIKNILPKKSLEEQKRYYEREKNLSEIGAFNIPFKDGKLMSKGNSRNDFNNFGIILGIACIILSFF